MVEGESGVGQVRVGQDQKGDQERFLLGTGVRRSCSVLKSFCQVAKVQTYSSES